MLRRKKLFERRIQVRNGISVERDRARFRLNAKIIEIILSLGVG